MEDPVDSIVEGLKKLDKESLLAYWIKGEFDEAKLYEELAERARDLKLPGSLVETFLELSKDSQEHGEKLRDVYAKTYGGEPQPPQIPPLEVYPILDRFSRAEDVVEGLERAMESELLAERVYETLAEKTDDEDLASIYRTLAEVERGHYERLMEELEALKRTRGL